MRWAQAALPARGGESAALARLQHYLWGSDAARTYFDTRNGMLGPDFSTKFSPWLAAGCASRAGRLCETLQPAPALSALV